MAAQEKQRGMFPARGDEAQFSQEEIDTATALIRSLAARVMRGEKKAPPLALYEAMQALMPQPAVEAIVRDEKGGRYALHRRPADEPHFGPNKLHITGGFEKPDRHGTSLADTGREMALKEMGLAVEYVAGPIGTYQWKRGIEHPTGWPNSQIYVFKVVGDIPEREDTVWYSNDELPRPEDMILGRAGELHLDFLKVYQAWVKNPNQPSRDLNEKPLTKDEQHPPLPSSEQVN